MSSYPFNSACGGAGCCEPNIVGKYASCTDTTYAPYDSKCFRATVPPGPKSIPCKNGVPYDCNCNLIQAPFSMPYQADPCVTKCAPGTEGYKYVNPPYFVRRT